jgi:hypothetical protein
MKMAVLSVVVPCSLAEVYQTTWHYNPKDSHLQIDLYICPAGSLKHTMKMKFGEH